MLRVTPAEVVEAASLLITNDHDHKPEGSVIVKSVKWFVVNST